MSNPTERAHVEAVARREAAERSYCLVEPEDVEWLADLLARERQEARRGGSVPAAAKVLAKMVMDYVNDVVDGPDGHLWVSRLAALKLAAAVVQVALSKETP